MRRSDMPSDWNEVTSQSASAGQAITCVTPKNGGGGSSKSSGSNTHRSSGSPPHSSLKRWYSRFIFALGRDARLSPAARLPPGASGGSAVRSAAVLRLATAFQPFFRRHGRGLPHDRLRRSCSVERRPATNACPPDALTGTPVGSQSERRSCHGRVVILQRGKAFCSSATPFSVT